MPALTTLRQTMQKANCDYYLVASTDPHQSEFVPNCWQRRAAISGFTGSAGDALIGMDNAFLWTDSRYFLQAEQELDANWQLMRHGIDDSITDWLSKQSNCRVGVDPQTISAHRANAITNALTQNGGALIALHRNLVDDCIHMPDRPKKPMLVYPDTIAGETVSNKLSRLRQIMSDNSADHLLVNTLDNIAWLTNTRGNDIAYNPLSIAYAIISHDQTRIFTDAPFSHELKKHWQANCITALPYDSFHSEINHLTGCVWYDPATTNWHTTSSLKNTDTFVKDASPITAMKAIKNKSEIHSMVTTHETDALALIRFFHWLETHWQDGITECSAARHLAELRLTDPTARDLSFPSISAFADHGAIIHYSPSEKTDRVIDDSSIYLLDSGGQYWGGTTDVTRCIHLGTPTDQQRYHYTLVLKAHLALRHAVFAEGTTGYALDCLTRQALWKTGYDYGHGTGHGVGAYLCVHEGPHSISSRENSHALAEHMIVSNEPGLYLPGKYGIRLENLMHVIHKQDAKPEHGLHRRLLGFSDLTLVPFDQGLIDTHLLLTHELQQLNEYHALVWERLSPKLKKEPDTLAWLEKQTTAR